MYFISYGEDGHVFSYARAGSAASLVRTNELPPRQIEAAHILHVSGISQAISRIARMRCSRRSGTPAKARPS